MHVIIHDRCGGIFRYYDRAEEIKDQGRDRARTICGNRNDFDIIDRSIEEGETVMKKLFILVMSALLAVAWYTNLSSLAEKPVLYEKYIKAGDKYMQMELYEDAVSMYAGALEIDPVKEEGRLRYANANYALGNTKEFVSTCTGLVEQEKLSKEALTLLTDYYAKSGKAETLVSLLYNVRTRYPEDEEIRNLWKEYAGSYHKVGSKFSSLGLVFNGYTIGMVNETPYLVNTSGEVVIDDAYENIGYLSADNKWIAVSKDGEWYYINTSNHKKMVSEEAYTYCGLYSEGVAVAQKDGKYGYIDTMMQAASSFDWDMASNMYHGVAAVCKDGKWALINSGYEQITDYIYEDIALNEAGFCSVNGCIFAKDAGGYHMLDVNGDEIGTESWDDAMAFSAASYAAVCKNGRWGFVGADGKLFIDYKYDGAKNFGAGYAPVLIDGKWGYIDTQDELIVKPQFEDAYPFCAKGTAPVKDGSYYFIQLYAITQ